MILHYGTKAVWARPMILNEYNRYQKQGISTNQELEIEGCLVEYIDGGKPNHLGHENYISWLPESVFAKSYKADGKLPFSAALVAMKAGKRVWRKSWKEEYVYYVPPGKYPASRNSNNTMAEDFPGGVPYTGYIAKKTYDGYVTPWVPTQEDMIQSDWSII